MRQIDVVRGVVGERVVTNNNSVTASIYDTSALICYKKCSSKRRIETQRRPTCRRRCSWRAVHNAAKTRPVCASKSCSVSCFCVSLMSDSMCSAAERLTTMTQCTRNGQRWTGESDVELRRRNTLSAWRHKSNSAQHYWRYIPPLQQQQQQQAQEDIASD